MRSAAIIILEEYEHDFQEALLMAGTVFVSEKCWYLRRLRLLRVHRHLHLHHCTELRMRKKKSKTLMM